MPKTARRPDGRLKEVYVHTFRRVPGSPPVTLRFAEVNGRLVLARVEIGADFADQGASDPRPIDATALRGVPLGRLARRAMESYLDEHGGPWSAMGPPPRTRRDAAGRPGRPGLRPEHYQQVADVYSAAVAVGAAPTRAVASWGAVKHPTAARWVSVARQRGYLPRTKRGQAKARPIPATERRRGRRWSR